MQKAAIIPFNADNHVISLSCGRKNVCTLVFQSATLKRSCFFIYKRYEQNGDISNILKSFRRVSDIRERGAGKREAGAECLLNARSGEEKLLTLHSAHILCLQSTFDNKHGSFIF